MATHNERIVAGNGAYRAMCAEMETWKAAYHGVLGPLLPTASHQATSRGAKTSVSSGIQLFPLRPAAPKLKKSDYPLVNYWDMKHFNEAPKGSIDSTDFLEDEDDNSLSQIDRSAIYSEARAYWTNFAKKKGSMPKPFQQTAMDDRNEFFDIMESNFPILALCSYHWKAKKIWIDNHHSWERGYLNRLDDSGIDGESASKNSKKRAGSRARSRARSQAH